MGDKEVLAIIKKTDHIIDNNPELRKAASKVLKTILKKLNASSGAILILNPLEKKLENVAKKGNLDNKIIDKSFKSKKELISKNSIASPISLHGKAIGMIFLKGRDIKFENLSLMTGSKEILDGRINYEHDSLGLKRIFSKYVGDKVLKKILKKQDEDHLTGEKRNCSILFADINGFTNFANSNPPEKVINFLNDFFQESSKIILKNSGTIDKFIGDEIMAIFGSPLPQKNHSEMALKTAKELIKKVSPKIKKHLKDSGISIGIATGTVISGNIGSTKMMDYTVIGKKVNLASRLTALANKNEILVDKTTRGTSKKNKFKIMPKTVIKGFKDIRYYKLIK